MDEFEKRLKRDAGALQATVSPELRQRIDASLRGTEPIRPAREERRSPTGLWWASSLTGLAAAVAVIVVMNWNRQETEPALEVPQARTTVPAETERLITTPLLDVSTAGFAAPLEEELDKLQSDIDKARESLRRDLDFTF